MSAGSICLDDYKNIVFVNGYYEAGFYVTGKRFIDLAKADLALEPIKENTYKIVKDRLGKNQGRKINITEEERFLMEI